MYVGDVLKALLVATLTVVAATANDAKNQKQKVKKDADDALNSPDVLNKVLDDLLELCGPTRLIKRSSREQRREILRNKLGKVSQENGADKPYVTAINCFTIMDQEEIDAVLIMPKGPPPNRVVEGEGSSVTNGRKLATQYNVSVHNLTAQDEAIEVTFAKGSTRRLLQRNKRRPPPPSPPPPPPPVPTVTCPFPCDWRNVAGFNYVPPVRDQGRCGSCGFFTARANWESMMMVSRQVVAPAVGGSPTIQSSTQYLVNCAPDQAPGTTYVAPTGQTRCQWGSWPEESWTWMRLNGQIMEVNMPYTSGSDTTAQPCVLQSPTWPRSVFQATTTTVIDNWSNRNVNNVAALRQALVTGPLSVTLQADFTGYGGGVWFCTTAASETAYNHAMLLIGVRDVLDANNVAQEAWVLQNSWGTQWGTEGGYIYITTNTANDCGVSQWQAIRPNLVTGNAP